MLTLVRVVAANWSLRTHVEASKPGHPYTFFSVKTAVTFIQLNAEPRGTLVDKGPHADEKHKRRRARSKFLTREFKEWGTLLGSRVNFFLSMTHLQLHQNTQLGVWFSHGLKQSIFDVCLWGGSSKHEYP